MSAGPVDPKAVRSPRRGVGPRPLSLHERKMMSGASRPDGGGTAVVIVDRRWKVTHVSPRFTELLGWPPELVSGRSLADLAHPDDQGGFQAALHELDLLGFASLDCRVCHHTGGWWRLAGTMTGHQQLMTLLCEVQPQD